MFPLFTENTDSRARMLTALIVGIAVAAGIMLLLAADGGGDASSFVPFIFIFFLPWLIAAKQRRQQKAQPYQEKAKVKRGLDGLDMYTLIDRMVDDLDDDEAGYLRRRLDNRENRLQREDTAGSLADLLDQRETDRYQDG
jgi:hypothetical protein